jgi:hypothetical protein
MEKTSKYIYIANTQDILSIESAFGASAPLEKFTGKRSEEGKATSTKYLGAN